ncbi:MULTISPECIES: hypothetical protein [Roseobacteraceae]|jgi:hypothetical protein|uniref:hypothetical protein n=1 Tax=Roseobacteraceae TaxID=2854170 RepID=UPI001153181B|nr:MULTISPECIES: hypothetical protein [Roseobacteraceae]QDI76451.1 hypothetical protein R2C4_12075 [Leisingera aquaemixtae]UWR75166.1 hypothetical protein K4L04_11910 [Phaeobacter inhibens]
MSKSKGKTALAPQHSSVLLPEIEANSEELISDVTSALGVDRELLPSDEQISHVWSNIPRQLRKIPPELRDLGMVRLCLAASVGLFDSSINYIWNATILELRRKISTFGLNTVSQMTGDNYTEESLKESKDFDLLKLCLQLNLLSEEAHFKLDQCRAMRNHFSAAHPSMGDVDEDEVISFMSRCAKYALSGTETPTGVDISELVKALKGATLTESQKEFWEQKISGTNSAQKSFIANSLHGIYCDPGSAQSTRQNCIDVASEVFETPSELSGAIDAHIKYKGRGEEAKVAASREFFRQIGRVDCLSESEIHDLFSRECDRLMNVHNQFDNFYNEVPFAERLLETFSQTTPPETVRDKLVDTLITCSVGNEYGTSRGADVYYKQAIEKFSAAMIARMLDIPNERNLVASRIKTENRCRNKYVSILKSVDRESVPVRYKKQFDKWVS